MPDNYVDSSLNDVEMSLNYHVNMIIKYHADVRCVNLCDLSKMSKINFVST